MKKPISLDDLRPDAGNPRKISCDVIVERWQNLTGGKAKREKGKRRAKR